MLPRVLLATVVLDSSRTLGGMKTPEVRSLYVLDIFFVAYHSLGHSFLLELFHSSDLEPHASPGLPECERRNPSQTR